MRFYARHGVHPEEALTGHWFEVDLDLCLPERADNLPDTLDSTLDYELLHRICLDVMSQRIQLLETLASHIYNKVREAFPQSGPLRVRVGKDNPPFPGFCRQVSYMQMDDNFPC